MNNHSHKKWVCPKINILNHKTIMGKENFNVTEQNKTGTDTSAVANAAS